MEPSNKNLKETLINFEHQNPQPQSTTPPNRRTLIVTSLILFTFIASAAILIVVQNRSTRSNSFNAYIQGSSKLYCHLASYPDICLNSMSQLINRSSIASNPVPLFSASLQIALDELRSSNRSISNAMVSIPTDSSAGSAFRKCASLLSHSLSLLNSSASTLGVDLEIEGLTYAEADNIRAWSIAAMGDAEDCLSALQDVESTIGIEKERLAVNEVKSKVDKASMCVGNWASLFFSKDDILYEFYNPIIFVDDDYFPSYYTFDFHFILIFYSGLYLFLILLYVLVLRGD